MDDFSQRRVVKCIVSIPQRIAEITQRNNHLHLTDKV